MDKTLKDFTKKIMKNLVAAALFLSAVTLTTAPASALVIKSLDQSINLGEEKTPPNQEKKPAPLFFRGRLKKNLINPILFHPNPFKKIQHFPRPFPN